MPKTSPVLDTLFNLQNEALANKEKCLTLYHTLENPSKVVIQKEIRALVLDCLKENLGENTNIDYRIIADRIAGIVTDIELPLPGIAIFLKFNLNDPAQLIEMGKNLIILNSSYTPPNTTVDMCVDDIFYLGLVFKILECGRGELIVNLSKNDTKIFMLTGEELNHFATIENVLQERYEDRYQNRTPGEGMHGGSDNEKESKFTKQIINDFVAKVKEISQNQKRFSRILVFNSDDFNVYSDYLKDELKNYSHNPPIVLNKNVDAGKDLKQEAVTILKETLAQETNKRIDDAKQAVPKMLVEGWEEVSKAAREGRIQYLFIKEGANKPGFVLNKDLPYIENVDQGEEVKNLCPWIVQRVIATDGDITILESDDNRVDEIAATLRY